MSLFPDQCVDDILKNGRRRFANHSGCLKLHYDAISLMSKNNVPGWGGNRIRGSGSWTQDPRSWTFSDFFVKCERILGVISENHLSESFGLVFLLCVGFFFFFLVVWKSEIGLHRNKVTCPSFQSLGWRPQSQLKDSTSELRLFCFCLCSPPHPGPLPPTPTHSWQWVKADGCKQGSRWWKC